MLRVYVTGGGCSGFSYGFNFAENQNEDDAEFINGDVKCWLTSLSYQFWSVQWWIILKVWKVTFHHCKTQIQQRPVFVVHLLDLNLIGLKKPS